MVAIARRLLFRIGTVGFCLNLDELVEIREQVDQQLSVVGALSFRQTMIPVIDLAKRLDIPSVSPNIVLVVNSREGSWGLLVGRVEGFYPVTEMIDRPVPCLLQAEGWRCFDQVILYAGLPYFRLDLSACYAGVEK